MISRSRRQLNILLTMVAHSARMASPFDCTIELNSFACGTRLERWSGTIAIETTPHELIKISRRCLLSYWKEAEDGSLVPAAERTLTPDEVVVRAPDDRALYRRTI